MQIEISSAFGPPQNAQKLLKQSYGNLGQIYDKAFASPICPFISTLKFHQTV